MKKKKVKEIGITALYERLSRDDDGDGDSNSIVHQKQMLEAYAKEHGFVNLRHYTDDGWSGASFDRPAWNELVAGVKAEEITTVIVKDLSRVGRDHLQVGFFTDILFREKEVHFIAIGNGIDSNDQQSSEFAPFLNIMKNKVRSGKVICDFSFFGRFGTINRCFLRSCGMFAIRYRRPSAIGSAVTASAEM